jgi:3,4-dihydroxy 2-butanone 4-phosphate synthase / GTP cyclohydrolase II
VPEDHTELIITHVDDGPWARAELLAVPEGCEYVRRSQGLRSSTSSSRKTRKRWAGRQGHSVNDADEVITALSEMREGHLVALEHDNPAEDAYLCMAASLVTPETINFLAMEARGIICLALSDGRCRALGLREMPCTRGGQSGFMVTIEARDGVSTGISAHDRARTILAAVQPGAGPGDLVSPGHVLPVQARAGGVTEYPGYAEAAVELAALSGLPAAAVVCAVMKNDGTMVRRADLGDYAHRHRIPSLAIGKLVAYLHDRRSRNL